VEPVPEMEQFNIKEETLKRYTRLKKQPKDTQKEEGKSTGRHLYGA
jgi:hypothetical protein